MRVEGRGGDKQKEAITYPQSITLLHFFSLETQDLHRRDIEAVHAQPLKLIDLGQGPKNLAIASKTRSIDQEPVR
jgi:hypothetical protein